MSKEEIEYYLKRIDELGTKLTGKDKETYAWLIYGYNQCAKLLNETEQQCKKQKEFIKYLQEELNIQIQEESVGCEITNKRYILEEILQKYKSIIGGK